MGHVGVVADALSTVELQLLRGLLDRAGTLEGQVVKAVASPYASNEDLGAFASLVERLGGGEIVYRSAMAGEEVPLKGFPQLARRKELAPNGKGFSTDAAKICDHEPSE